jgi:hypothetical protein
MCQYRARALHDSLARYHNPHLQHPIIKMQNAFCQNLIMGQSYEPCRILLPAGPLLIFVQYTAVLWLPQAPAWQACPWEHRPSSSAPCAVPMRLSRIGQHIKDEPCAKKTSVAWHFSSRSSSVSRGVRSAGPILT